jgi:hypothetical protein
VALRDPGDPSIAFSAVRVPRALRAGAVAGLALLLAIVLAGALGAGHRRRPAGAAPAAPATAVEPPGPNRGGEPPGAGS